MSSARVAEALPRPVVDTHCHMDVAYDKGHSLPALDEAMAAAEAVGVTHVIQVGCDVESSRWAVAAAEAHDRVWATVAIHPNDAARDSDLHSSLAVIAELARNPVVRGIGETGLDYFRTPRDQAHAQHESFRAHIDICRATGKPLIIHDRDAHDDVIATLVDYGAPDTVVFHCFSGDVDMARLCASRGWYMSFAGVVTFKNAAGLRDALAVVPDELVLVETDSPYLTPAPHRGEPNSSAHMPNTVRAMAEVRGVALDTLCDSLFSNAARVFGPL